MASIIGAGFCFFACWIPYIFNPGTQPVPGTEPDIAGKTFDYIVVGGGLTGLTVANRLSEDSRRKTWVNAAVCITH